MSNDLGELQRLRAAFAAGGGRTHGKIVASSATGCFEPDRLWRAVVGELDAPARRALVDHTAACAACAAEWRLAAVLAAEASGSSSLAPSEASGEPGAIRDDSRWLALAALAAGLLIAFGLWDRASRSLRIEPTAVVRAPAPVASPVIAEDADLPRDACHLRWSGPTGARYDLRVFATSLAPIVEAYELETTDYSVPPELLADLPPGTRLWWQVEARLPDGSIVPSTTHIVVLRE